MYKNFRQPATVICTILPVTVKKRQASVNAGRRSIRQTVTLALTGTSTILIANLVRVT